MEITSDNIKEYIEKITEPRKTEIEILMNLMEKVTHKKPKLWGSIVGFGSVHYTYETGHQGDMPILGFANRKHALTLYLSCDIAQYEELKILGKHTIGKGCLYIKKLTDVDLNVLESLMIHAKNDALKSPILKLNEE